MDDLINFGHAIATVCNPLAVFFYAIRCVIVEYCYAIEDGCVENLDYEVHARGKNWIATVTPNRAAPGGLDRVFWKHGSAKWYKFPTLGAGDVIEMAGDYYSGRGRKSVDRRYIFVIRVEADHFVGVYLGDTAPSGKTVTAAFDRHFGKTRSQAVAA